MQTHKRNLSHHYMALGQMCMQSWVSNPQTFHIPLHFKEKLSHTEILTWLAHISLSWSYERLLPQPSPCKGVVTGVGVYLSTRKCCISLTGSSSHQKTPLSLAVFSVQPPPQHPPALHSLLPLAAVVIGYDTGSTGREQGRIWMCRMSSSSLLFSNLLPCSS